MVLPSQWWISSKAEDVHRGKKAALLPVLPPSFSEEQAVIEAKRCGLSRTGL